jgi:hexosaminidase
MYSAADMYSADPAPSELKLPPSEVKLILGGEACMWGEQVSSETADSRIWPRSMAVAERLWSPGQVSDINDMYRRLAVTSLRLDALGITHITSPERGLRQLAGGENEARALQVLASVLQPVDFHVRSVEQHTSPLTPLDRLIDFTRPDPPAKHNFQMLVNNYLHDRDPIAHQKI